MIFAAGFGTRMKHLTRDRPKPMVCVDGRPMIDHALALARDLPAETIVANLHYKPEILAAHLKGTGVRTVLETPDILDTGGGLRNAMPLLGNPTVMTLNPDVIWHGPNPLKLLETAWEPDVMDGLLMCIPNDRSVGHQGRGNFVIDGSGRITRGDGVIYGGAQIIKTERLMDIPDEVFSLNRLWDILIAENSLYAMEFDGFWCDVGHPDGIAEAEKLLRAQDV
jgi:MurNAc alpha-1-phosphate uridylyltransferase